MTFTVYIVVDPKGDRPYVSSSPPSPALDRRGGEVRVFSIDVFIPDFVPVQSMTTYPVHAKEQP